MHIPGSVSDEVSDCETGTSVKTYDRASGLMRMQIEMTDFDNYTRCRDAINPVALGYDATIDGTTFTLEIDVHSLFAALVVGYKINGNSSLEVFQQIDTVISSQLFRGVYYDVERS